jgi:hypothetical protein
MKARTIFAFLLAVSACLITAKADVDLSFNASDFMQLFTALQHDGASPDYTFAMVIKKSADMPAYDPQFYYAGMGLDKKFPDRPTIWISDAAKTLDHPTYTQGLLGAMALMAMDNGHAGEKWKNAYDIAATADAQLDAARSDRYLNRHLLREAFLTFFRDKIDMRETVQPAATATP